MKNKPLDIVLLIFKIIIPILIILPLVFFTYLGIRNRIDYLEAIKLYGEQPGHYGMAEFLMALILAFINLCVFILTAICLLIAHLFKSISSILTGVKHSLQRQQLQKPFPQLCPWRGICHNAGL